MTRQYRQTSSNPLGSVLALGAALAWLGLAACGVAQESESEPAAELRLYQQDPYDQITLRSGEPSVIKVEPIRFPDRLLPPMEARRGGLRVRLLEAPDQEYNLDWSQIAEIKLFEQLVLDDANALVAAGRLDEAFDYFRYLDVNQPKQPGLDAAFNGYLMADATVAQRGQRYDMALAILNELHERDPGYERLQVALGAATTKLAETKLADQNYAAVRKLAARQKEKYPQDPVAARIEATLIDMSEERVTQAQAHIDAGRLTDAYDAAVDAVAIWPTSAKARQLIAGIHQRHPKVVVAVTVPARDDGLATFHNWASARTSRLVHRQLVDFIGYGPDGGQYASEVAEINSDDAGRTVLLKLRPGLPWSDGRGEVTAYDVARRLLEMADPASAAFRPAWGELLGDMAVRRVYEIELTLTRRHVRPRALLDVTLAPSLRFEESAAPLPTYGPYTPGATSGDDRHFLINPHYPSAAAGGPREIVERYFATGEAALTALKQGRAGVVDRINPWAVDDLQADPEIIVERYAVPTVHCLLPNLNNKFLARRALRRALVYGIDRQGIVDRLLLRGNLPQGSRVVSGPFPAGTELDDPLGYAYNDLVETRPYEPRLAITLAGVAVHEVRVAEEKRGVDVQGLPELVLAHPPHDIARVACQALQQNLKLVGVPVALEELDPWSTSDVHSDYDLVYAEMIIQEPIVDAQRLFREDGAVGSSSPHLALALRQLLNADDWTATRSRLREVHRIAHDDVSVIPLWQLAEHFAYHRSVEGVGQRPAWLYQHVDQWRPQLRLPASGP